MGLKLSKRLATIAKFVSEGVFFADIGTDHAYLPCYICMHDLKARAIAGEVREGPLERARQTVQAYKLEDRIQIRLGNGLSVIGNDTVTEVVIAGMGGLLISNILEEGKQYLKHVDKLILQPNVGEYHVRKWLFDHQFKIIDERLIQDGEHFYEVIVAQKLNQKSISTKITEKELLFGPCLLLNKHKLFYKKWRSRYDHLVRLCEQMNRAQEKDVDKINAFKTQLTWIKEVISDE